jgi:hypothetical protein
MNLALVVSCARFEMLPTEMFMEGTAYEDGALIAQQT